MQFMSRILVTCLGAFVAVTGAQANPGSLTKNFSVEFHGTPFLRQGDAIVLHEDIDAFLAERVPEQDRAGVLQSAERIGRLLNNLLLSEHFVALAQDAKLLQKPEVQARLYRALAQELRSLYTEHYFEQNELESYETLARELYLTQPNRFRSRRTVDFRHLLIGDDPERAETEAMRLIIAAHEAIAQDEPF